MGRYRAHADRRPPGGSSAWARRRPRAARGSPSQPPRSRSALGLELAALLVQLRRQVLGPVGEQRRAARRRPRPATTPPHQALATGERLDGPSSRQRPGGGGNRPATGCSEASSSAPTSASVSSASAPATAWTPVSAISPLVTVPVLSRTTVSTRRVDSRISGPPDDQPELRAAAGADEQRGRRRQAERAGTGDDQHRNRRGEGEGRALPRREPEDERRDGDHDDDRDEDRGDAVGEPLHRRLAALRVADQLGDLGEGGVGSDLRRADDDAAARVDRCSSHLGAGTGLDRRRLWSAGSCRGRRSPRPTPSVATFSPGRTTNTSPTASSAIGTRRCSRRAPARRHPGSELQQRAQRLPAPALRGRLEPAPGEDEGGHDRGRLQVDLAGGSTLGG